MWKRIPMALAVAAVIFLTLSLLERPGEGQMQVGNIIGTVVDSNGQPLAGVVVVPTFRGTNSIPFTNIGRSEQVTAITDGEGSYGLTYIPAPASYQIYAYIPGQRGVWLGERTQRAGSGVVELEMGTVEVADFVIDPATPPAGLGNVIYRYPVLIPEWQRFDFVSDVSVTIEGAGLTRTATTDDFGFFDFDLPPGDYIATAHDPTAVHFDGSTTFTVIAGEQPRPTIEVRRRNEITVQLFEEDGTPIFERLGVSLRPPTGERWFDGGTRRLDGVPAGDYQLVVTRSGGRFEHYWPGVTNSADAGDVAVTEDQTHVSMVIGDDLALAERRRRCPIVVGSPGEDLGQLQDAGAATVLTLDEVDEGVAVVDALLLTQALPDIPGIAEAGDEFGGAVACGDFDRDGFPDIAIGSPGEDIGSRVDAGAVHVFFGQRVWNATPRFDVDYPSEDRQIIHQGLIAVPGIAEPGDRFGASLATGDVNGDGVDDLIVGSPGESVGSLEGAGAVHVFHGMSRGRDMLTGVVPGSASPRERAQPLLLIQGHNGIRGIPEPGDAFGHAVAVGPEGLVVAAPGEDLGTIVDAGLVHVLDLTADQFEDHLLHQGLPHVEGLAEAGDRFGDSLCYCGPLIIGAPREDIGARRDAGAVTIVNFNVTTINDQPLITTLWQGKPSPAPGSGVGGVPEAGDLFGASVGFGVNGVIVGAPGEDIGGITDVGVLHQLNGFGRVDIDAGAVWWRDELFLRWAEARSGDLFGSAIYPRASAWNHLWLTTVSAPGAGGGQLLIGVNGTDVALTVDQTSPRVPGADEDGDNFGAALAGS